MNLTLSENRLFKNISFQEGRRWRRSSADIFEKHYQTNILKRSLCSFSLRNEAYSGCIVLLSHSFGGSGENGTLTVAFFYHFQFLEIVEVFRRKSFSFIFFRSTITVSTCTNWMPASYISYMYDVCIWRWLCLVLCEQLKSLFSVYSILYLA